MSTSNTSGIIRNHHLRNVLWASVTAATALLVGCGPTVDDEAADGCLVGDDIYLPGETFTAPDGCNTCTCGDDGAAACTEMACTAGCFYDGEYYDVGESIDGYDDCNSCFCESDGSVACTTMACPTTCTYDGQVYNPGDEFEPIGGSMCGNMCTCLDSGEVFCDFCAS